MILYNTDVVGEEARRVQASDVGPRRAMAYVAHLCLTNQVNYTMDFSPLSPTLCAMPHMINIRGINEDSF
jgi:hypothetical protein